MRGGRVASEGRERSKIGKTEKIEDSKLQIGNSPNFA